MAEGKVLTVACPVCATQVAWLPQNAFRPFCSQRCKMIDLGDWATEAYKIPCETPPDPDSGELL